MFKLTYATMYNPPEELHTRYEAAVQAWKERLGRDYPLRIGGEARYRTAKLEVRSPINRDWLLGTVQKGTAQDVDDAVRAAKAAFATWGRTPWQERVRILRRAADLISENLFEIGALVSLEVGKPRMEALADVAEAADLIRYACDQMEAHNGYVTRMGSDPIPGYEVVNHSVLKPYGVWVVISPFNFPAAISAGPAGAALVAGNTVVLKPAPETPITAALLVDLFHQAGVPAGALNLLTGDDEVVGQGLVDHPLVDGLTFTGSYAVGMHIYRCFAQFKYPRPLILEMGGKNAVIVSRHADLERAVQGIVRSAFGLQGQKCSAASRIFIEAPVYDDLVERIVEATAALKVGDPTQREVFLGPVINERAYRAYQDYIAEIRAAGGKILTGGQVLTEGPLAKGYFVAPTVAVDTPKACRLWQHEMFLPITMLHRVSNLEEAMAWANEVDYGLTAGFYGTEEEAQWFFDHIQAGVVYANRPQGASTGAWPGYQPFGGWKASGSTGKNAGGPYYLPLYMREQSQTLVR